MSGLKGERLMEREGSIATMPDEQGRHVSGKKSCTRQIKSPDSNLEDAIIKAGVDTRHVSVATKLNLPLMMT